MQPYPVECTTNCILANLCASCLQFLLKFSSCCEWLVHHFPNNGSSCSFTYFTRTPFSRQIGSQPMFFPFPNDGPNHTDGDLEHVRDLSISHSTIMMVNYNHMKLRELLCPCHVTAKSLMTIQTTRRRFGAWRALIDQRRFAN